MAKVGYRTKYRMFQATGLKKNSYTCDLWLTCNKIQTPQGFSQSQHLMISSTCLFFPRFKNAELHIKTFWYHGAPFWGFQIPQAFRNQRSRDSPQHSLASHKYVIPKLHSSHHWTRPSVHPHEAPTEEAMSSALPASDCTEIQTWSPTLSWN